MPQFRSTMMSIFSDPGFRIHLIVYVAVNLLLIVVDVAGSPDNLWFYWPLLGWGLGVVGHGFAVYQDVRRRQSRKST